jgi:hypothetical protein
MVLTTRDRVLPKALDNLHNPSRRALALEVEP